METIGDGELIGQAKSLNRLVCNCVILSVESSCLFNCLTFVSCLRG